MNETVLKKHGEKVVKKVMRRWRNIDSMTKKQFEEGLGIIISHISKHTKIPLEEVGQHTHQVIEEFGVEYEKVPDEMKGYEAIISLLYAKYMQKLGMLE